MDTSIPNNLGEILPFEEVFDPITPTPTTQAPHGLDVLRNTRTDVMRRLMDTLPLNDLGLPNYIYRSDMIPTDLFDSSYTEEDRFNIINSATYNLDYAEGYPSQIDGTTFWAKLNFEPPQAYTVFLQYLGVVLKSDLEGCIEAPVRTLTVTSKITNLPEYKLREMSYLYYWPVRAKAHDLFMVANFQKQREMRALSIEDDHYRKSVRWIKKAEDRLQTIFEDEDLLYDMKPKEVFNMLKELMTLQRISAGLPASGPSQDTVQAPNASLATLMRAIAAQAGEVAKVASDSDEQIAKLFENPEMLMQLQAMVIKTNSR